MKVIIANSRTEEMVGDLSRLSEKARASGAWGSQRMLWFAADGDIVVLPWLPPKSYLDYVTGLTGVDQNTLSLIVPPPGELGHDLLSPDRLADPHFRTKLAELLEGKTPKRVMTCFDDYAVVNLVTAMGLTQAMPGYAFSAQGGVGLVNSKAVFRAVATGADVAIPPGVVTSSRQQAAQIIKDILAEGEPVMIKQEYAGGGFGNRILAPVAGVQAAGALEVTVLDGPAAVDSYVEQTWEWMTAGNKSRVVIEKFFTGCTTVYSEFELGNDASDLSGTGQILMEPVAAGEIVPPPFITPAQRAAVEGEGLRLSELFRVLGYRGRLSADAIVTSDGDVYFTETNGRVTGSTHLHTVIRAGMLGEHSDSRTLLERDAWSVPSFDAAVMALDSSGLGFARDRGEGIIITANYVPVTGAVMYCVVAKDHDAAEAMERQLFELSVAS